MKKVIVIGSPGAGKSTFARKLRDCTGLPLYYLDMIWHRPDRTNISREEFEQRIRERIAGDRWILDGNYLRTMEMRLAACDTVFFLDYSLEVCLRGAETRSGKPREDLPWAETEFDEEFRQWILDFPRDQKPRIGELLKKYRDGIDIYIFRDREEAEQYLQILQACGPGDAFEPQRKELNRKLVDDQKRIGRTDV